MSIETILAREERADAALLIAFCDLTNYTRLARRTPDEALGAMMNEFFERSGRRIRAGGGHVVKFIGDASLVVFPESGVDRGVETLLALKDEVDAWMVELGHPCRMIVKAHFGHALAGPYAGHESPRFDVLGKAVNEAATLPSRAFAISVDAFRKLSPDTRKRFKKHTPRVTYIRTEDSHLS